MRILKFLKFSKEKDDLKEGKVKVRIDRKGRLYVDTEDLAASPEFWRQVELAAKIPLNRDLPS